MPKLKQTEMQKANKELIANIKYYQSIYDNKSNGNLSCIDIIIVIVYISIIEQKKN